MIKRWKDNGIIKVAIAAIVYMAIVIGLAVFSVNKSHGIMEELLKKEMVDVARSAAASIDGDFLIDIHEGDENTSEYKNVYDTLTVFLKETQAKYIYVVRRHVTGRFGFVLDTDPDDPGKYGEPVMGTEAMEEAVRGNPSVDDNAYEDRWGTFYSAYCPVYDSTGKLAGLVCADFPASWYEDEVATQMRLIIIIVVFAIVISVLIIALVLWNAGREAKIKEAERDELALAKSLAEEANNRRNEFLDMMSHEIRTPISMVMGMDEMILRESVEKNVREYASDIRHAGNVLLSLVDEVLDMSQIDNGDIDLHPVRYDPMILISDLTEIVRTRLHNSSVRFFTEIDDNIPSIVFGDSTRMKQCLLTLLSNSLRYTKEGEIHFSVKRERIRDNYVWLRFCVSDTGEGVPKEAIKRMVDYFETGEELDEDVTGITELGLSMISRFLRQMDTKLEFESKLGEGSKFFFVVKQSVIDEKPVGDYKRAREVMSSEDNYGEKKKYIAPDAKILLVDDEKMNLAVVKTLLQSTQIQIDTTMSGAEALELMAENTYDVLIFDHLMREIDGVELLRLVRENRDNPNCIVPCIVLTANAMEGAREEYLKVGFDAYLSKPVNKDRIESVILRYLPRAKVKFEKF